MQGTKMLMIRGGFAAMALIGLAACSPSETGDSAEAPDETVVAEADAPEADASEADAPEADAPEADASEADAAEADAAEADAGAAPKAPARAQSAQKDDDDLAEERALADRLMTAMGIDVMVETLPDIFAEATARSVLSCTPATPRQDVAELERLMREELTEAAPRYFERLRDSYVRRLTLEQLQAMVDFYETPEGQEVAEAAGELVYDQYNAQIEIDRASTRAYERMGWCDNAL